MKTTKRVIISRVGIAAAITFTTSVEAQNLLVDPSFENGTSTANPITLATVGDGWAPINGAAQSFSTAQAQSGTHSFLVAMSAGDAWDFAGPYQVVGGISSGQNYTAAVSFLTDTGFGFGEPNNTGNAAVGAYVQLAFFDSALAQIGTTASFNNTGDGLSLNTWYSANVSAVAPVGSVYAAVYLAFMEDGAQANPENVFFDNASLTPAPEPSTMALMGMGLTASFYFFRRRNS